MASVAALVCAGAVVGIGVFAGLFLLAFLDYCPAPRCSADGAFAAVGIALLAAVVLGIAGLVVSITRLSRRRTAWPYAVGTMVLCLVAVLLGGVGYFVAVG